MASLRDERPSSAAAAAVSPLLPAAVETHRLLQRTFDLQAMLGADALGAALMVTSRTPTPDLRVMRLAALPLRAISEQLGVDLYAGLSDREAERRLLTDGPNELPAAKRKKKSPKEVWVREAATAMRDLERTFVVRGGVLRCVPVADVAVGDVLFLSAGMQVPCDCRALVCAPDTRVDEAAMTGDPEPVLVRPDVLLDASSATGASDARAFSDSVNVSAVVACPSLLLRGTAVARGYLLAVVLACGRNTVIANISELVETMAEPAITDPRWPRAAYKATARSLFEEAGVVFKSTEGVAVLGLATVYVVCVPPLARIPVAELRELRRIRAAGHKLILLHHPHHTLGHPGSEPAALHGSGGEDVDGRATAGAGAGAGAGVDAMNPEGDGSADKADGGESGGGAVGGGGGGGGGGAGGDGTTASMSVDGGASLSPSATGSVREMTTLHMEADGSVPGLTDTLAAAFADSDEFSVAVGSPSWCLAFLVQLQEHSERFGTVYAPARPEGVSERAHATQHRDGGIVFAGGQLLAHAPAMKRAEVGMSFGPIAADVSSLAADAVLTREPLVMGDLAAVAEAGQQLWARVNSGGGGRCAIQ